MNQIKKILKKILPESIFLKYHYCMSLCASLYYGQPSKKMIIIGVTGTKGKTSTSTFIWAGLQKAGVKTGLIGTAEYRVGKEVKDNPKQMTMPGRFALHQLLSIMQKSGCEVVVVEVSSEGIKQFRHIGIYFDFAVFTNLSPEHLQSHKGSFELYKKTKAKLFQRVGAKRKYFRRSQITPCIYVNSDDSNSGYFRIKGKCSKAFSIKNSYAELYARVIVNKNNGTQIKIKENVFTVPLPGVFNVYNALPVILLGQDLNLDVEKIIKGIESLTCIPGRMEKIQEGQGFTVYVDYAHEKVSVTNVLEYARSIVEQDARVVILLGGDGGGRDIQKRFDMGEVAGKEADIVIVCDVDPYGEDRAKIADDVAQAAIKEGKIMNENLFVILDRREAIRYALTTAKKGDVILIVGKGNNTNINITGVYQKWDDRVVVREILKDIEKKQ